MSVPAYDRLGLNYSDFRRSEPRIETAIWEALGDARSVVNVGAGAGSYEPTDREVIAVEPSPVMIAQRPQGAAPALEGVAEALPLDDKSVDAVPAPNRCRDEFTSALWDRPELFLDAEILRSSSLWHRLSPAAIERGQERLRTDLESGVWDEKHGHLRTLAELDIGLRLVREEL